MDKYEFLEDRASELHLLRALQVILEGSQVWGPVLNLTLSLSTQESSLYLGH